MTAWMKENQHRQKELAEKYPQEQFRNEDIDEDEVVGLLSNRAKETVRERQTTTDGERRSTRGKKTGVQVGCRRTKDLRKRD